MPQLDLVNIVTISLIISFVFYQVLFVYLGKLKTFLIVYYNILLTKNSVVNDFFICFYNYAVFFKKQQFIFCFVK